MRNQSNYSLSRSQLFSRWSWIYVLRNLLWIPLISISMVFLTGCNDDDDDFSNTGTKLSVSDIVKGAFKLGNKHWIYVFGFYIIASQVAQLGVLLCIVGIIFTASIVHLPVYYFYKDTIGFDEEAKKPSLLV